MVYVDWTSLKGRKKYLAYLKSPEWDEKRRLILARSNGVCEQCRSQPAAEVHHLHYNTLYRERLCDLLHVCRSCHVRN